MALVFTKHPLIGEFCVPSDHIVRYLNAAGEKSRKRVGKVGSLVMLKPDPEVNTAKEAAWFGILTWVQPDKDVRVGRTRLCEVWWVYSKKHLMDVVKGGEAANKKALIDEVRACPKKQAWVSNHFSDEPLGSIMTIPNYTEVCERIKLSQARYLEVDVENGVYEFVKVAE